MPTKNNPPTSGGQELSPTDQFHHLLPLARMLVAAGAVPDITLAEFDATTKLMKHVGGTEPMGEQALREIIRVSRPNRAQRRRMRRAGR